MKIENPYKILEIKPRLSILLFIVLIINIVIWINTNFLIGSFFTILVFGVLFLSSGFIIDNQMKKIRRVTYFLGFTIGKWYDLPKIEYISLLRVKKTRKAYQASSAMFVQATSKNYSYQINFIISETRPRPFRLISTTRERAIKEGLKLGEYLDLKVLDVTTPEKKWIR